MKTAILLALATSFVHLAPAVPRPWSPLKVAGGTVSAWGRDYTFASNALPVSVTSLGRELLAGPIRLVCADKNGQPIAWTKHGSWVHEAGEASVTVCGWSESPTVTVDAVTRIDFDGMMEVSLALVPGPRAGRTAVTQAWLEIPFRPEVAKYYQYFPFTRGQLENAGAVGSGKVWPFYPSMWLGDEKAGFCWFCESLRGFAPTDESRIIEAVPGKGETVLRVRLVDRAADLPRTWRFGLEATPMKPFDRSWNANHVLHSPPMGAGMTIKRPEVWWTAQRAFPNGHVGELMDGAAKAGVKTVAFHEDWIPIQNNPTSALADFGDMIAGCHRRGMKVLVYDGYEMSPLDPEWGRHHGDWLAHGADGRPISAWYRPPAQRDYRSCLASGFAKTWLERAKRAYDKLGVDGYYLDGTAYPWQCFNEAHGCGWRDEKGVLRGTYPIFAVRETMREIYAYVDGKGGVLNLHASGCTCPATMAFGHAYWDGEQLVRRDFNIKRSVSLEAFRAEFMGRNHGLPCEFLAYEVPGWSYEDALALSLIHDVLVRPCGFGSEGRLASVWKALDDFGFTKADWTPYWENPLAVSPASVKASVYTRGARRLAVVSNLSPDRAVTAEVTLPAGVTTAKDAVSGETLPVADGKAKVELAPFRMRLVLMTAEPASAAAEKADSREEIFWNARAVQFVFPPAFDFPEVTGAVGYRFCAKDAKGVCQVFTNASPKAALTPIWDRLSENCRVTLTVDALDGDGKTLSVAGCRSFWRMAAFHEGAYPPAKRSYAEAARKAYDYIFDLPSTQYFLKNGKPDPAYGLNAYPSKMHSALVQAMIRYSHVRPDRREPALRLARQAADYLMSVSQPAGAPLAWFPPTYDNPKVGPGLGGVGPASQGKSMLLYPALVGRAYLALFRETGDCKYREAAVRIGETYLKLQGEDGTWTLKVDEKTGEPVNPNRAFPLGICRFLSGLSDVVNDARYGEVVRRGLDFVRRGPMRDWNWEGQFEDVEPSAKYRNLTKHPVCDTAIFLLETDGKNSEVRAFARKAAEFAEDQFVCWQVPCDDKGAGPRPGGKWGTDYRGWRCPSALEQYECYVPIDASAVKLVKTYLALWRELGDPLDLAKAKALADSLVNVQFDNGRIPTFWMTDELAEPRSDWLNCMIASALLLDDFSQVQR